MDMPICPALEGMGAPEVTAKSCNISENQLPRCKSCGGLLRPHVVWFGESLSDKVMERAETALQECDLMLVVGTSAVVQPAASFAPAVRACGGIVAEFNMEDTPITADCRFKFRGSSATTLPQALAMKAEELTHPSSS